MDFHLFRVSICCLYFWYGSSRRRFTTFVAVLISMTCFTGTGQFAGIALIVSGGMYVEMLVTTFIINIRYLLMSLSLSQKIESV